MLLRSITKHVKDQNWFAVALDFFIVVVGILIAFQITNWNEGRVNKINEGELIQRLETEFIAHEKLLTIRVERARDLATRSGKLSALIRAGQEPDNENYVKKLIWASISTTFGEAPPITYSELVASGKLSELSDAQLRAALYNYGRVNARWERGDRMAYAITNEHSQFRKSLHIVAPPPSEELVDATTVIRSYDWEKLKQAEVSVSTIEQYQWNQFFFHNDDLKAVRNILAELKRVKQ